MRKILFLNFLKVKKFSDKLAIDDGVNQISYGELDVQVILLLKT